MAKKKRPSLAFVERIRVNRGTFPSLIDETKWLIRQYRPQQTKRDVADGNMEHLRPVIVSQMEEQGIDELRSARTFASLSYVIEEIKGDGDAAKLASKARRIISKHLGAEKAKQAIRPERTVKWRIDRTMIREGGPELVQEIQALLGRRVSLSVGPIPKRVRKGKERKGRQ